MKNMLHAGIAAVLLLSAASRLRAERANDILESAGVAGGLVVHLGCGDGTLTAQLRINDSYLVHGLDTSEDNIEAARAHIRSEGLYGKVSVDLFDGRNLPYKNNLVNLVVADSLGRVPMEEVMRVLAPLGVACINGTKTVKPWPDNIDQWTHFLHGPDNNAVAQDDVVGSPHRVQWICEPAWSRHHDSQASLSALVSSRGKLFYIMDEGPTTLMHVDPEWSLFARDAFSGVFLWKRPIGKWVDYLRYFREGPTHLPRRLVAVDDCVYVTLGYGEPVSVLDAGTGTTTKVISGSENAEEIICNDDCIFVVVNPEQRDPSTNFLALKNRGKSDSDSPKKSLKAFDSEKHTLLWEENCVISSQTLAALGDEVFYHSGDRVICADARTGNVRWRSSEQNPTKGKSGAWYAPTLVASQKAVLLGRGNSLWAFSTQDGQLLWSAPMEMGFLSPSDVFVINGLVWYPSDNPRFPVYECRDLISGEVKKTIDTSGVWRPGHHHRCYRNKATTHFIITSKRGLEFLDLNGQNHTDDVWIRGECQYGIIPSNGLTYAPPHPCMCYSASKINGFYAVAAQDDVPVEPVASQDRLYKGPEYAQASRLASAHNSASIRHGSPMQEGAFWSAEAITDNDEWPDFRHDPARSGSTRMAIPDQLRAVWQTKLGTKLSTLVSAGGKVFVALPELNAVQALDAATGDRLWAFTVGGPVDSPPTIYGKLAVFGSADGFVYCVNAENGKLVWRFMAAPVNQRIVSYGHLESTWPVHGSPLIHPASKPEEKIVYFAAGRTGHLDGGMYLYGVNLETGMRVYERIVNLHSSENNYGLSGILPDIPVANGTGFQIRGTMFNEKAEPINKGQLRSMYAVTGFLDDAMDHRSFWVLGSSAAKSGSGAPSIPGITGDSPYAKLFSFDADRAYGYRLGYDMKDRMTPDHHQNFSEYQRESFPIGGAIFSVDNSRSPEGGIPVPTFAKGGNGKDGELRKCRWIVDTPLHVRAMLLASDRLCVAGWYDSITPKDLSAGAEGMQDGSLLVMSTADGTVLAEYTLPSPPVFDGLIAANDCLYLSLKNGEVMCLSK